MRAKGVAISTCSNWLNNFIIVSHDDRSFFFFFFFSKIRIRRRTRLIIINQGLITPPLVQDTGFGAYTFFAVFCLLSLIWTFFFVPETMGRSLEEMDHIFKDNSSAVEQERRRAIEVEVRRAEANHVDP